MWDDSIKTNRRNDIEALLNFSPSHEPYRNAIGPNRIGAVDHSLGGCTVLGLAGAWANWRDKRFRAVLALALHPALFLDKDSLRNIAVPTMYQVGSEDSLIAAAQVRYCSTWKATASSHPRAWASSLYRPMALGWSRLTIPV
jgi:predicted dienelactone hydrolase